MRIHLQQGRIIIIENKWTLVRRITQTTGEKNAWAEKIVEVLGWQPTLRFIPNTSKPSVEDTLR